MAGEVAPAGLINQRLGMFDAKAHREGLGLHGQAVGVEHGEGVTGAVAHGHHHVIRWDQAAIAELHPAHPALAVHLLDADLIHPALKADLASQSLDLGPQAAHHGGQLEGADVGPMQHQNLWVGAGGHQFLQHLAAVVVGIPHLAVELAVGEGAGAAFPELGIGFRVERCLAFPEAEGVGTAFLHGFAPLQQQGSITHLGQHQGAEIAAGPSTDHHRSRDCALGDAGWGPGHELVAGVGCRLQMGVLAEALQQLLLQARFQFYLHAVGQLDVGLLAGIHTALHHPLAEQGLRGQLQASADAGREVRLAVLEGQPQFIQPQHPASPLP